LRKFSDLRHLFTIDIDLRPFNVLAQIESLGQLGDKSWHFTTKKRDGKFTVLRSVVADSVEHGPS